MRSRAERGGFGFKTWLHKSECRYTLSHFSFCSQTTYSFPSRQLRERQRQAAAWSARSFRECRSRGRGELRLYGQQRAQKLRGLTGNAALERLGVTEHTRGRRLIQATLHRLLPFVSRRGGKK
eukprot:1912094-Rhodomonas_salina.2